MNLKKNKITLILLLGLILLFIFSLKVNAANASIKLEKSSVELGNSVNITVSGQGVQWNLKLKVDGEELKTDSELENYEENKNINFSVVYTPKTTGNKKVTLEGSVTEFSDGSTVTQFNPASISVNEKTTNKTETTQTTNKTEATQTTNKQETATTTTATKSNNANLSTLGVTPKEYDFSGFNKNKTEYSVTIPNDVNSLKVLYKTADSKASVKVSGNSNLEVGSNKIEVVVTAEDGKTSKTYTINVTKLAAEDEKPGNVIEDEKEGIYLTSLSIEGTDISPEFKKDVYSYTATLKGILQNEIQVNAVANNEQAKIEISGNKNITFGENIINVLVTRDGSLEQKVYQITLNVEESELTEIEEQINIQDTGIISNLMGNLKKYMVIAISVIVGIIALVIILICIMKKERNNDETEEYNVYENDEDEFKEEVKEQSLEDDIDNKKENTIKVKNNKNEKGKHSK